MKPPAEGADFLSRQARELGLAALGCAAAGPAAGFTRFRAWLNRDCAAGMAFLERGAETRQDPRRLLPEARTVIVAAARYPGRRGHPAYSSYAQGRDYHEVMGQCLRELAERLARFLGAPFRHRVCVDTAPILEREWAARAGLGWIGRQGSLVHPQHGCRLFLGEILAELDLPPTPPMPGQCGDCRRCLDACPAGAFTRDGFLDARRCLSYLTLEHRGPLPAKAWPAGVTTLAGCDACTAACPFNPPDDTGVRPEFLPSPETAAWPGPEACLTLDEPGFKKLFSHTALARLGLERLQRNARAVLDTERDGLETGKTAIGVTRNDSSAPRAHEPLC